MSDKPAKHAMKTARACLLACAAVAIAAQAQDALNSPACVEALESLQSARSAGAGAAAIEARRSAAAASCLGSAAAPHRPGRVAQPPVVVPPPQIDVPVRVAPLPGPVLPPPPVAIDRMPTPALCDPGGCWANDGTHLRQVGPNLGGPNGPCIPHGAQIACP